MSKIMQILLKIGLFFKFKLIKGNEEYAQKFAKLIITKNHISNFKDVNLLIQQRKNYTMDKFNGLLDIMQDLDITIIRNWKGDCDDFALAAYRLLEQLNYQPSIIHLITTNYKTWHTICGFKIRGELYTIGTEGLVKHNSKKELFENHKKRFGDKVIAYDFRKVNRRR